MFTFWSIKTGSGRAGLELLFVTSKGLSGFPSSLIKIKYMKSASDLYSHVSNGLMVKPGHRMLHANPTSVAYQLNQPWDGI